MPNETIHLHIFKIGAILKFIKINVILLNSHQVVESSMIVKLTAMMINVQKKLGKCTMHGIMRESRYHFGW